MKRNFLLLATLLMMQMSSFGQYIIENGGFENWTINTGADFPVNWSPLTIDFVPTSWSCVTKTTIAKKGDFAARVNAYQAYNGTYYPGLLYKIIPWGGINTNEFASSVKKGGAPFSLRPRFMKSWIFFETIGNDSIYILATLRKWDFVNDSSIVIGEARATYAGYQAGFTEEKIYFQYYSQDIPDSIQILIMAGNSNSTLMTNTGSYVIIDEISFFGEASGTVFYDLDSNGIKGSSENGIVGQVIKMEPGPYYTETDIHGNFYFPLDIGITYTLSYVPQQYWDISNASSSHVFTTITDDTLITDLNFGIYPIDSLDDVRVFVSGSVFRCSSQSNIWIDYCNYGTTTVSDVIELIIDSAQSYIRSNLPPDYISGNHFYWNYSLVPGACKQIHVIIQNPDFSSIGDTINVEAYVYPLMSEYSYSEFTDIVRCSYDPNDKNVNPRYGEENLVLHGKQLEYLIRFQNTGNDTAFNIVIKDTLDANLNPLTFKIIGSSHAMTYTMEGTGIVSFIFEDIMLPDSNVNEFASHGYVKYTIKPKAGLVDNTVVENTAYIYFDSNPAVITNTIHSTYVSEIVISVSEQKKNDIKIYPNPTTGLLHITATESEIEKVVVHNITGKEVSVNYSPIIDLNTQPDGVYFITIVTNKGVATKKVMVAR